MEAESVTQRSPIWARLQSVDEEYAKLVAERDQARAERDAARAVLEPFLAQLDELKAMILAQMPKTDTRLPSARKRLPGPAQKRVSEEQIGDWCTRHIAGETINAIAKSAGVSFNTVHSALIRAGIEVHVREMVAPSAAPKVVEKTAAQPYPAKAGQCTACGPELDSLVLKRDDVLPVRDGVCGLCQLDQAELAKKRADKGNGNGH